MNNERDNLTGIISVIEKDQTLVKFNFEINYKNDTAKKEISSIYGFEMNEFKVKLNFEAEIDFNQKTEIDEFASENSVKINDISKSEIEDIIEEIRQNVQTEFPKVLEETGLDKVIEENMGNSFDEYEDEDEYNADEYNDEYNEDEEVEDDENDYNFEDDEENDEEFTWDEE